MPFLQKTCVICAAPFGDHPQAPEWMKEFRALYTTSTDWNSARLSDTGTPVPWPGRSIIPIDPTINVDISEVTVDESWVEIDLLRSHFGDRVFEVTPSPLWGYPVHPRCWGILSLVLPGLTSQATVQALFDICRSQPIQGVMDWGHNYEGLIPLAVPGDCLFVNEEPILNTESDYVDEDASEPMLMQKLLSSVFEAGGFMPSKSQLEPRELALNPDDPFRVLPPEIITEILIRLNLKDVHHVRLVSTVMAQTELSDRFWKSRFWPGRELAHVFEALQSPTASGRYRTLYTRFKAVENRPEMIFRKRVWSLATRIGDLVQLRLQSSPCRGHPCRSWFEPHIHSDLRQWRTVEGKVYKPFKFEESEFPMFLSIEPDEFTSGTIALWERFITLPSYISGIDASFVIFNDKKYISGLRILSSGLLDTSIGYFRPQYDHISCERLETGGQHPTALCVTVDARGIRGVRLQDAWGHWSKWIGDYEGVPKRILTCPGSDHDTQIAVGAIKCGFDALKMVSISISSVEEPDSIPNSMSEQALSTRTSSLWYPNIPDPDLRLVGDRNARLNTKYGHIPYSLVLFGGRDGYLLPHLTHITFWTMQWPYDDYRIRGIEFHYAEAIKGQTSMQLGEIPALNTANMDAHHVALDSELGERLRRVELLSIKGEIMSGVRIFTTEEREFVIPPTLMSNSTAKEREFVNDPMVVADYPSELAHIMQSLSPENGEIVGMYASVERCNGLHFLGLACKD